MAACSDGGTVGTGEKETVLNACLDELKKAHDKETVRTALETLLKLATNAIQHPRDEKFRNVRVENKNFNAKVWCLPEAQQFLMVWGWVETDDGHIALPTNDEIQLVKQVLLRRLNSMPSPKQKIEPMTEKEKKLQEERRLLQEKAKAEKKERERIKAQIRADRDNVKTRESKASKATHLHGGGHMTKFKDIGIDLDKGGGG